MTQDSTHEEIEHQKRVLVDDYGRKLLETTSRHEDLRHSTNTRFMAKKERQKVWEHNGTREYLLEPLRKVIGTTSGYYSQDTSPADNIRLGRNRLRKGSTRFNEYKEVLSGRCNSDEELKGRHLARQETKQSESMEHLERCLRVHSLSLNQIKK